MDKMFTQYELSYLDDIMPSDDKNKQEDEKKGFYGVGAKNRCDVMFF
jgi:hypothetical protein